MSINSAMDSLSTHSDHSIISNDSDHHAQSESLPGKTNHSRFIELVEKSRASAGSPPSHRSSITSIASINGDERFDGSSGRIPQMIPMPYLLSGPPGASAMQSRMFQGLSHMPPHSLLNSFMNHGSPFDLMSANHHVPSRSYNCLPPVSSSDPTVNECKLVDYRGQKVAAFIIQGDTMLCLPQAFALFLKHLVGGLHTVHCKLKRLQIVPLVCNVEQVRVLRGLGAIQPGVNRCKLLASKDFDALYRDCTTARCLSIKPTESSRPGRPPKRVNLEMPQSPPLSSQSPQLKKHRSDNGDYPYENGHLNEISHLDKSQLPQNGFNGHAMHLNHMPFMQMSHHENLQALMHQGMNLHEMNGSSLNGSAMKNHNLPEMEALARSGIWENCRAAYEDVVKHLGRYRGDRSEERVRLDQERRSELPTGAVLNLSKSGLDHGSVGELSDPGDHSRDPSVQDEDDILSDVNVSDIDDKDEDFSDVESPKILAVNPTGAAKCFSSMQETSISSTEILLLNIQELLKVAADNARQQERQLSYEKAELKMNVLREREVKDSLEKKLPEEQKLRALYQKRYKREHKLRCRLQEQINIEYKKRNKVEEILKTSAAHISPNIINMEAQDKEEQKVVGEDLSSSGDRKRQGPISPNERKVSMNSTNSDRKSNSSFWKTYPEPMDDKEVEKKAVPLN